MIDIEKVHELVLEAHEEDARSGSHFDRDGWGNYFIEEWKINPENVTEAWAIYENEVWGLPPED